MKFSDFFIAAPFPGYTLLTASLTTTPQSFQDPRKPQFGYANDLSNEKRNHRHGGPFGDEMKISNFFIIAPFLSLLPSLLTHYNTTILPTPSQASI